MVHNESLVPAGRGGALSSAAPATKPQFLAAMAHIERDVGVGLAPAQVEGYWVELRDLDAGLLQAAARAVVRTHRWNTFPKVAEILDAAAALVLDQPNSWDAWSQVRRLIGTFGYTQEAKALACMAPLLRRATEAIGWQELCDATNLEVVRAQWVRCYESMAERERRQVILAPVVRDAQAAGVELGRGNRSLAMGKLLDGIGKKV